MTTVLILSDTHMLNGKVPEPVLKLAGLADKVLHAGDFCSQAAYDALNGMCKDKQLLAVRGHETDDTKISTWDGKKLPIEMPYTTKEGIRIGLVHGHQFLCNDFKGAMISATGKAANFKTSKDNTIDQGVQVLVFGHMHYPMIANGRERMLICPGSPTRPMGNSAASVAWLKISEGKIQANIIRFESHISEYQLNASLFNV